MLQLEYLFKLNCLNTIHNITRQERQACFAEITAQYETMIDWINSKMDAELQTLESRTQTELNKLR